jgi:membrane protease YdiL (CAAX protease family)
MTQILALLIAAGSGIGYFVFGHGLWVTVGLFLLTLMTRFNSKTQSFGKFVEILFIFSLISFAINQFGIYYPYSLVIVLTVLLGLIFLEGPDWSHLYFSPGKSGDYFKLSLLLSVAAVLVFGLWIYFDKATIQNPVPLTWPVDTLIIMGIGFAFYLSIVEEIIFRSFIFERAKSATGTNWAIAIQATFFGFMYYRGGVPSGIEGAILGGLFGIALGYLVKKTNSIYLSMLVHFIVTLAVFTELTILGKL